MNRSYLAQQSSFGFGLADDHKADGTMTAIRVVVHRVVGKVVLGAGSNIVPKGQPTLWQKANPEITALRRIFVHLVRADDDSHRLLETVRHKESEYGNRRESSLGEGLHFAFGSRRESLVYGLQFVACLQRG